MPALILPDWLTAANGAALACFLAVTGGLWTLRNRDLARQRAETKALRKLVDEIFGARSAVELHDSLLNTLQSLFDVGALTVYVHNRAGQSLHAIAPANADPAVVSLEASRPSEGLRLAFQQREPLLVEDPRLFPCPVLWLPMKADGEITGVLECRFSGFGKRPAEDARHGLQHIANQLALAILLLDQRQMQEDILRGERLGAALELISGVAAEARASLDRIQNQAAELERLTRDGQPQTLALQLRNDAAYARSVLERLVSFGKGASAQPVTFDWNAMVRSLIAFRSDAWRLLILEPDVGLCPQQLPVCGVRGQLEQALLGLLVHAEQSLRVSGARKIRLTTALAGDSGALSIEFCAASGTAGQGGNGADLSSMSMAVIRGILESQGGSLTTETAGDFTRIEVRLPLSGPAVPHSASADGPALPQRSLTLLVSAEGEEERRRAVELAAEAGHRAIPAGSAAETLELLSRLRFDAVLASSALPDMSWIDLAERVRASGAGFVLLDVSQSATPADIPVVHSPFEPAELRQQLTRLSV